MNMSMSVSFSPCVGMNVIILQQMRFEDLASFLQSSGLSPHTAVQSRLKPAQFADFEDRCICCTRNAFVANGVRLSLLKTIVQL